MLKFLEKLKERIGVNQELKSCYPRIRATIGGMHRKVNSELPALKYTQDVLDDIRYITSILQRGFELKASFTKKVLRYYEFSVSGINLEVLFPEEIEFNNLLKLELANYFAKVNAKVLNK